MQITARKLVAASATVALLASSLVVPMAEAVDITVASADRTTFTLDLPVGVDLAIGDDITLVVRDAAGAAVDLSSNDVTAVTVGGNNEFAQVTNNGDAAGRIVITDLVANPAAGGDVAFTLTSALPDNAMYTVAYYDNADNVGLASVNFGTANTVVVSATVVPTLSMSISTLNANLGTLSPSAPTVSTGGSDITIATNAVGGYTLSAAGDTSDDTNMPLAASTSLTAGTAGFGIYVSGVTGGGAATEGFDNDSTTDVAVGAVAAAIASYNAPTASSVVTVKYKGSASAVTPADNYTLTTTYTISGTF